MISFDKLVFLIIVIILLISCDHSEETYTKANVHFKKEKGEWRLYYHDKPFYIKGANGMAQLDLIAEIGGNSVLILDRKLSDLLLNKADILGLKVSVLLDIGKPRFEGVNYKDPQYVFAQRDSIRKIVIKYANHPSILLWCIGNEIHLRKRNNIAIWKEVNEISKMIHSIDPNHPTTTTIASFPTKSYQPLQIKLFAPDLDFISLTIFEFAKRIKREYDSYIWGFDKPFLVTEWSGTPYWMCERTDWNAIIQPTSTENAQEYFANYSKIFEPNKENCLGGYVFYWGQKQERTHTVFSLLLEDKYKTQAIENIQYLWTGTWPTNWCPRIDSFYIEGYEPTKCYFEKESKYTATLLVHDPDNDTLKMKWEIRKEGSYFGKTGGATEEIPEIVFKSDTVIQYQDVIEFSTPSELGKYRFFVYVYDNHEYVATANIPFYNFK